MFIITKLLCIPIDYILYNNIGITYFIIDIYVSMHFYDVINLILKTVSYTHVILYMVMSCKLNILLFNLRLYFLS